MPGRLGDPRRDWRTDPRLDPFMITALAQCGLDDAAAPAPVNANSPLEEKRDFYAELEPDHEVRFKVLNPDLPPIENVERRSEVIKGGEFRNGVGKLGNHPFPAGLNDCMRHC